MKRLLHYFLAVLFVFAVPQMSMADTWDGMTANVWTSGSGTEESPYLIESAANLSYFLQKVNAGTTYSGVYFKMVVDIDLSSNEWTGIGTTETKSFQGTFDGDGHTIIGINTTTALFAYVKNATIKNLSTKGSSGGGGIIYMSYGTLTVNNCHNAVSISTTSGSAGGIVCKVAGGNASIMDCSNSTSISSSSTNYEAGGIVGLASATCIITNCHNRGSILSYKRAGGIVGHNTATCTITDSYNNSTVSASYTLSYRYSGYQEAPTYTYYAYAGGIVGHAESTCTISKCYNKKTINAKLSLTITNTYYSNSYTSFNAIVKTYSYSSGILGYSTASSANVLNCYNLGAVQATALSYSYNNSGQSYYGGSSKGVAYSSGIAYVGGCKNCYTTGTIQTTVAAPSGSTQQMKYRIGSGSVTNCYYLETLDGTGSGTSRSNEEMKSTTMPGLLNATENVYMMDVTPNVNDGYPIFGNMPYLVTNGATNVSYRSATLNGTYYFPEIPEVQGFEYKKSTNDTWDSVHTSIGTPFEYGIRNLEHSTTYKYRAFAVKDGASYYGEEKTFSTLTCESITASISALTTRICQGDSATFVASGTSAASDTLMYLWNTGASGAEIIATEAGTYQVTVTDVNGCTATKSITLTVNPLPAGGISGNTSICEGHTTTLTAPESASYVWSTGEESSTIVTDSAGIYTCLSTSSQGCSKTNTVEVRVNPVYPNVVISQSICVGSSYNFFETLLTDAGEYSYNGTTTEGCDSTVNLTLTVNPLPIATISGDTSFCEGGSSTLFASGGIYYLWNDGETTQINVVSTAGTHTVVVTDENGCSDSAFVSITVKPRPIISITGDTVFCEGSSSVLTAQGGVGYVWNNESDESSMSVSNSGEYTVTGTGENGCENTASATVIVNPTYNISTNAEICQGESYNFYEQTLTAGGAYMYQSQTLEGCDSIINLSLIVNSLPVVSIDGNTSFCEGGHTILTASNGTSYRWNDGANEQTMVVSNAGVYGVTVTDSNGCKDSSFVTVTTKALPNVTISGNTIFCEGSTTLLTAHGGESYLWNNDSSSATITVSEPGIYSVTGIGTNGCSNHYEMEITISSLPVITISGRNTFCNGDSTTLIAFGADTYFWSNGATTTSVTINTFGTLSVVGVTDIGCMGAANVSIVESPNPDIRIVGNSELCPGETATLTAIGGTSYEWFDGSTLTTHNANSAGSYSVIGYNEAGCHSMASVDVTLHTNTESEVTVTAIGEYICNGNIYTESGDYTYVTTNAHGCDSTITLHLTIEDAPQTVFTINVVSSNPVLGSVSGGGEFSAGEHTSITASANSGSHFLYWNDGNTQPIRHITVNGDATYTAYFATNNPGDVYYTVTVLSDNESMGSVYGGGQLLENTCTIISALANDGYHFVQWSDGNTNATRTVYVTQNTTYVAYFAVNNSNDTYYTINVLSNNESMGSAFGGGQFMANATTTIIANARNGYHFVQWNDGNTQSVRNITVTGNASFTASFAENNSGNEYYTIHTISNNDAMGTAMGGGQYLENTTITISAEPNVGYHFVQWNDGNTNQIRTIVVTGNDVYTAYFATGDVSDEYYTVTVISNDATMGSAIGGGHFRGNTVTTIIAAANAGYHFVSWNDGNDQPVRSIIVTSNISYIAYFEANTTSEVYYTITVVPNDERMGFASGSGQFLQNSLAIISAEARRGYVFVAWSDGNTQSSRIITVTENATYTAYFQSKTGIDDISDEDVKVYARGSEIVVEGAENIDALIYDVMGRIIHKGRIEGPIHVNSMGVYMVKIGGRQPRKVVVR